MRGAWIEIVAALGDALGISSLPVRGAWIEIATGAHRAGSSASLPVRGAWIEICLVKVLAVLVCSRSPCGERGLKCNLGGVNVYQSKSLPVRGAWIEIDYQDHETASETVAPRAGSVD